MLLMPVKLEKLESQSSCATSKRNQPANEVQFTDKWLRRVHEKLTAFNTAMQQIENPPLTDFRLDPSISISPGMSLEPSRYSSKQVEANAGKALNKLRSITDHGKRLTDTRLSFWSIL